MKNNKKLIIFFGVFCVLLTIASFLYTAVFNDERFIAPMDMSDYVFRVKDLPVIISCVLLALYVLYIFLLIIKSAITNKNREEDLGLWDFGLIIWIRRFFHLCSLCFLDFSVFSMRVKCQIP